VPSPKGRDLRSAAEMSAFEMTRQAGRGHHRQSFDTIVVNFANPDMVGHTGIMEAAKKAVEAVDTCIGRLAEAVTAAGGSLLITADHGNIEQMVDPETGEPYTAHTTNPVPVVLVNPPAWVGRLAHGKLADIAPTLLALLGIKQPAAMTGQSLLVTAERRGLRPDPARMRRALFWSMLAAAPALAADPAPDQKLKQVERKIENTRKTGADLDRQAQDVAAEISRLQDQSVASARIAQDNEARLTDLEARIAVLSPKRPSSRAICRRIRTMSARCSRPCSAWRGTRPRRCCCRPVSRSTWRAAPCCSARWCRGSSGGAGHRRLARPAAPHKGRDRLGTGRDDRAAGGARCRAQAPDRAGQAEAGARRRDARACPGAQQSLVALTSEASDLKELIQRVERERERKLEEEKRKAAEAKAQAEREAAERAAKEAEEKRVADAAARGQTVAGGCEAGPGPGAGPGGGARGAPPGHKARPWSWARPRCKCPLPAIFPSVSGIRTAIRRPRA